MDLDTIISESKKIENSRLREWKDGGGKVVGYICISTPVELLEAAGVLPYRIRALGNADTEMADVRLSRFNCSFCRSCLELGLNGTYDFLDGIIETNGCDHLRGMVENWQHARPSEFFHYLRVPHINDADSKNFFEDELKRYRQAIEEHFDVSLLEEDIWVQARRQERVRDKLRTVYEMRERTGPAFTGAEVLSIFLLATAIPAKDLEEILDSVIEERKDHKISDYRARLLFAGSATDEVEFVKAIESMGGLVVTDALCFGSRAFWPQSAGGESEDPIKSLARTYLDNLLCPRMFDDFKNRRKYVDEAIKRANVDGVVLVHNKFCDVHGVDNVQLRMGLEKQGVPVLQLEKDYGAKADIGRMKTRVQAFLERIGDTK